jgi:hypothetical protein
MRKSHSKRTQTFGLTLIEAVIAIFCLAILSTALNNVTTMSSKVGRQNEARAAALGIATKQLEKLAIGSMSNRALVNDVEFALPASIQNQYKLGSSGIGLRGIYSVQRIPNSSLHRITVRVRWANFATSSTNERSEVVVSKLITRANVTLVSTGGTTNDYFYAPPPPAPPRPTPPPATPRPPSNPTTPGTNPNPSPNPSPAPNPNPAPSPTPTPNTPSTPTWTFASYGQKWSLGFFGANP